MMAWRAKVTCDNPLTIKHTSVISPQGRNRRYSASSSVWNEMLPQKILRKSMSSSMGGEFSGCCQFGASVDNK